MNEIILFQKMNSMKIAEIAKREHKNVLRDIRDEIEKLENSGIRTELMFELSERQDSTGRTIPYYELTKEGVLQLAARYDAVVRAKLIELAMRQDKQLPSNYKEALLALVASEEEKEQLVLENKVKESVIERQRPKVLFAEAVEAAVDSILIRDLAKLLNKNGVNIGQNRLFDWLRKNGYLQKRENKPTQKAVDLGVLELKEGIRFDANQEIKPTFTTKVTGKGQIYFLNKFKSEQSKSA